MMRSILATVLCLLSFILAGQSIYEGVVKDSLSNAPLSYVNIGVVKKNIGTVSDKDGKFKIALEDQFNGDSLRISIVGYRTQTFMVSDFKSCLIRSSEIKLIEDIQELHTVIISSKRLKETTLGNNTKSTKFRGGFTNSDLGNELGIAIRIKKGGAFIKTFNAFIVSNTSDSMKFRLNFYDLKDGLPNTKIIRDQIIFPIRTLNGKFTFDLSQYNIEVDDDFFVSLELIENFGQKDKRGILFSAGFLGNPFILRTTSQSEWEKIRGVSLGFNVVVQY